MSTSGSIIVKATIKNTGNYDGTEVVQLYIQDKVGSIVRPVKELKDFQHVELIAGESKVVEFTLDAKDLAFYGRDNKFVVEPGGFNVWVSSNRGDEKLNTTFAVE